MHSVGHLYFVLYEEMLMLGLGSVEKNICLRKVLRGDLIPQVYKLMLTADSRWLFEEIPDKSLSS